MGYWGKGSLGDERKTDWMKDRRKRRTAGMEVCVCGFFLLGGSIVLCVCVCVCCPGNKVDHFIMWLYIWMKTTNRLQTWNRQWLYEKHNTRLLIFSVLAVNPQFLCQVCSFNKQPPSLLCLYVAMFHLIIFEPLIHFSDISVSSCRPHKFYLSWQLTFVSWAGWCMISGCCILSCILLFPRFWVMFVLNGSK